MKNKYVLAAVSVFALIFLSGCYDKEEIDTLANVVAVSAEKKDGAMQYSFAVADIGSFGSASDEGSESGIICCTSEADSINNAVAEVNRSLSKKLSFSHMTMIIVSKDYTKSGIDEFIEYFERMPDVRPQTLIAASDLPPSEYLEKMSPSLEVNSEKYFLGVFQRSSDYIPVLRLCDYTNAFYCYDDIALPLIDGDLSSDKVSEQNVFVSGSVVLNRGKYKKELNDNAVSGLLNSTKNVILENENDKYIMQSVKKPKIYADIIDNAPYVTVDITLKNNSGGQISARTVADTVEAYLSDMAKTACDTSGIRRALLRIYPPEKLYERDMFDSVLKKCSFNVNVKII